MADGTTEAHRLESSAGEPAAVAGFASGVWVVVKREMGAYFDSPIAYIYATVFLVLSSTTFMNSFFLDSIVDMSAYFDMLPFLLIPFVPAISTTASLRPSRSPASRPAPSSRGGT